MSASNCPLILLHKSCLCLATHNAIHIRHRSCLCVATHHVIQIDALHKNSLFPLSRVTRSYLNIHFICKFYSSMYVVATRCGLQWLHSRNAVFDWSWCINTYGWQRLLAANTLCCVLGAGWYLWHISRSLFLFCQSLVACFIAISYTHEALQLWIDTAKEV